MLIQVINDYLIEHGCCTEEATIYIDGQNCPAICVGWPRSKPWSNPWRNRSCFNNVAYLRKNIAGFEILVTVHDDNYKVIMTKFWISIEHELHERVQFSDRQVFYHEGKLADPACFDDIIQALDTCRKKKIALRYTAKKYARKRKAELEHIRSLTLR